MKELSDGEIYDNSESRRDHIHRVTVINIPSWERSREGLCINAKAMAAYSSVKLHWSKMFIKANSIYVLSMNASRYNTEAVNVPHLTESSCSHLYTFAFHSLSDLLTPPLQRTWKYNSALTASHNLAAFSSWLIESISIPSSESLPSAWARRSGAWERLGFIAAHRHSDLLLFTLVFSSLTAQPTLLEMQLERHRKDGMGREWVIREINIEWLRGWQS